MADRHFIRRATTLLDVSRITTGKLRLERTEVDICVVVRQVAATLDPIARYSGSPIGLDLPAGGLSVLGDGLAIEQIVDNLVSNAIKYGGGKPIIVNVTADATIGAARMSVKDGGPGISADSQARIFERFERAVPAAEHKAGFGVGLWIVRQLVEAMNGMIAVTSTPGLGSAFCVILPMKPMKDSHEHDVA